MAWDELMARKAKDALEQTKFDRTHQGVFVGTCGDWTFQVFQSGMDPWRKCEVMATYVRTMIIRLPPDLAEMGLRIALEQHK